MKFLASTLLVAILTSPAMAFELEGVYSITDREACAGDNINTIVLYSDVEGETFAAFSSSEYGISYQLHALSWDGAQGLTGTTTAESLDGAVFAATISDDRTTIEGEVDSLRCAGPWTFRAELLPKFERTALEPLADATLASFVGLFSTATSSSDGVLRLMMIGDALQGNYGNEVVPRLISFTQSRLDVESSTLELFAQGEYGAILKWRLSYGILNGRVALTGYAINSSGRYYAVNAVRQ